MKQPHPSSSSHQPDDDPAGLVERVYSGAQPPVAAQAGFDPETAEAADGRPRSPNPHIKTVSVQYGRKLNLGDYNSAEISLTLWADLDEGEDVQAALDAMYAQAKENVKKQALPLLKSEPISLNYRDSFLGVPVEAKKEK